MALLLFVTSELPDISMPNTTNVDQKGQKGKFFSERITSGSSEVLFLEGLWRTLITVFLAYSFLVLRQSLEICREETGETLLSFSYKLPGCR